VMVRYPGHLAGVKVSTGKKIAYIKGAIWEIVDKADGLATIGATLCYVRSCLPRSIVTCLLQAGDERLIA